MLALSKVMRVDIAGRVFVALLFLLTLSGSAFLYWSLGRRLTLWPLVGAAFLYNWILLDGFLSYLLGVSLVLWGLGAWIAVYDGPYAKRLLVGAGCALVIFFCHLAAFGLFGLTVSGYTLARTLRERGRSIRPLARNAALLFAIFLAPIVLLALSPTGGQAHAPTAYVWIARLVALRTLFSDDVLLDICLLLLIVLIVFSFTRRYLRIDPDMRLPLTLVLLAFLLMPETIMTSWYVASRLLIAGWLLLLASSTPARGGPAEKRWLTLAVAVFIIGRSGVFAVEWHSYDALSVELTAAFDALPPNSVVFSATTQPYGPGHYSSKTSMHPPIWHWADLAVLRRQAFVPAMHAQPGQQPLTISRRFADIYAYQGNNPISVQAGPSVGVDAWLETLIRYWGFAKGEPPPLETVVARIRDLATAAGLDPARVFLLVLDPAALPKGAATGGRIVARGDRFILLKA